MNLDKDTYERIFDNLYDGLYLVDRKRVIQYWNKAAERITGYPAAEVVGKSCGHNILTHVDENGKNLCKGKCPLAKMIAGGKKSEVDIYLHHKDGHRVPVSVRVSPLTDELGNVIGGVELFTDISNFKAIEMKVRELEDMALLDNLTRLANRNYMEKEFSVRFEERKRLGVPFGLLFMDIDHFKKFNDTYGHDAGDLVLKFVANTLAQNLRPFDVVGRWGGEEFVGIMRNVTGPQLEQIGNRLRALVASAYILWQDEKLQVTISMGGTLVQDQDDVASLLKRADTLLYQSKASGRNRLTMG